MSTRTIAKPFDGIERRISVRPYYGTDRRLGALSERFAASKSKTLDSYATTIFLGMLMLFIATLSIAILSKESIRLDEAQSLWQTTASPQRMFVLVAEDVHVPLYHTLLHYWRVMLGENIGIARLFSLIFFLASIPAMYHLGRIAYGKGIAMFAVFLMAISPFLNWYGSEARMYSMLVFMTILNQFFFLRLFQKPEEKNNWIGYAATAILGVYVHYFFGFALISQAIFFFLRKNIFPRDAFRKFAITALIVFVALAPWLAYVYLHGAAQNTRPLLVKPSSVNLFNVFSEFVFGFQSDHLNTIIVSLWPLAVLLGFFALRRNRSISPETFYFILGMIVPIMGAFTLSFVVRPFFVARYLILALPSLYLFLGWLFSTYPQRLSVVFKTALIAAMLFSLGIQTTSAETPVKEEYKSAVQYLNVKTSPEDIIIVSAPFTIYPIEYYYTGVTNIQTLPIWDRYKTGPIPAFNESTLPQEVAQLQGRHQRAFLVLSYNQGYEQNIKDYFDSHYERLDAKTFSADLSVYEYKLRYDQTEAASAFDSSMVASKVPASP